MAWYRRSKSEIDTINRFFNSKITAPKTLIRNVLSVTNHKLRKFPNYSKCPKVSSSLFSPAGLIGNKSSHFSFVGSSSYRFYSTTQDSRQGEHYSKRWFEKIKKNWVAFYGNVETIPYTYRKHRIIISKKTERSICESVFKELKADRFEGKMLDEKHPESVRVNLISKNIIEGLERGLKNEMCVDKSRKAKGVKSDTTHLDGLNWEILVVNDRSVNAFCLPGGKIVVFTGLLNHFTTDEEIAMIIAHEVAHVMARHAAEKITKKLWLCVGNLIVYEFFEPKFVYTISILLLSPLLLIRPFSRRMEIEADYIGLLLMASAGYDPRVAPKVFEKFDKVLGYSALSDYLSTHPSGKKRSKLLSKPSVMQDAVSIYQEAIAGREPISTPN